MMFAEKLKTLRKQKGLTQKDMEVIYSIPVRTLQNWETGKAQPPIWAEDLILKVLKHDYNLK